MFQGLKKIVLQVRGMHCASCEVLIERTLKKVPGVEKVSVSYHNGKAELLCSTDPNVQELDDLIKPDGYHVSFWHSDRQARYPEIRKNTWKDYFQMGGIFLCVISLYYILRQFDLVPSIGISSRMSYGVIFLIGLFAAMSTCIAVVGGLLLALAEKYNELYPELTGAQKFKPHVYFNVGRIVGYAAFGAAVGGLGSVLSLSAKANGYLIIAVSFVMLMLGFQLLHFFPWMRRFSPKMPKFVSHTIHDLGTKDNKGIPLILGALTFFLPCGFTQALQLYVLASGDWKVGALTMFVFALGTLPALLSLSVISSFAKGAFERHFLRFAGVLVVSLALLNINNGLALAGINFDIVAAFKSNNGTSGVPASFTPEMIDGKQIVKMKVSGYDYIPSRFTVVQGIPVEWQIDGGGAAGCGKVLVMPTLGITKYLSPQGITIVTFIPTETGTVPFNCSMGMMTRGAAFTVVPNPSSSLGADAIEVAGVKKEAEPSLGDSVCNPAIMSCRESQKAFLEISRERGVYPTSLTVKKGVPVDMAINSKVPLGGCMSVWIIPRYGVTIPMKVGINKASFIPTETGTIAMTCSMGSKMAEFKVID